MPARATRWSSDFPRSRVIASAQRPALPRRSPGLAQCGLPAASPGQAYAARLAARPADLDGRGRHLRPAPVRADGPRGSRHARCLRARQPGHAGRPEGDAAGALGHVLSVRERGYRLARSSALDAPAIGSRDQDRLPKLDTAAPRMGTNGPGQVNMADPGALAAPGSRGPPAPIGLLGHQRQDTRPRTPCCQNTVMPQCRVTPADQPRHKARVHVGHPPIAGDQPGCWPSPPAAATGPADCRMARAAIRSGGWIPIQMCDRSPSTARRPKMKLP